MGLRHKRKKQHGTTTTIALVIILVLILVLIWSEFISGPNRVKEQIYAQRILLAKTCIMYELWILLKNLV